MQAIKKVKTPKKTEKTILEYLKKQEKPIKFYKLYKDLNYSAGKAQSAIKRLIEKDKVYLRKRVKRFENLIWYKDFNLESKIIDLKEKDEIIFPFRLNRSIGYILQEIPELTSQYQNLSELFKEAIVYFFRNRLSQDLRKEAVLQAVKKGTISNELGKEIMGD